MTGRSIQCSSPRAKFLAERGTGRVENLISVACYMLNMSGGEAR